MQIIRLRPVNGLSVIRLRPVVGLSVIRLRPVVGLSVIRLRPVVGLSVIRLRRRIVSAGNLLLRLRCRGIHIPVAYPGPAFTAE